MSGTVLAIISDTHIGSTTGLATPTYNIQTRDPNETQEVQANVLQRWLWECWTDFWAYVREKQGKGKNAKRLIVVHLGDVIDNVHHSSTQVIPEVGDQMTLLYMEHTAKTVTAWLSGGVATSKPRVTCRITTNQGRVDDRSIWVKIAER